MISEQAGVGLPVASDYALGSERRTRLFGVSSASLWFSVKTMVQQ